MPEVLKWSGVCVHCRARISGEVKLPVRYPATFREFCLACDEQVVIVLLPEGAMIAKGPRYLKEERKKS